MIAGHLTDRQRERYRDRRLAPEEIAPVYAHLAACETCRAQVSTGETGSAPFSEFLVDTLLGEWSDPIHLTNEEQVGYVDDALDRADRQVVESHLEVCPRCVAEVRALRSMRTLLDTFPARTVAPTERPGLLQRLASALRSPLPRLLWPVGGAAVTAAVAFWLGIQVVQPRLRAELRRARAAVAQSRDVDAGLRQDLQKAQKEAQDADARYRAARQKLTDTHRSPGNRESLAALSKARVDVPPSYRSIHGAIADANEAGSSFALLSPVGTKVATDRPTFRWRAVPGAVRYAVRVVEVDEHGRPTPRLSADVTATEWTAPHPLPRGRTYHWSVTTSVPRRGDFTAPGPGEQALFDVMTQNERDRYVADHAAQALQSLHNAAYDDAARELEAVAEADPHGDAGRRARQLLQDLVRQRFGAPR